MLNVTELLFSLLRVARRCSGRIHGTMLDAPRRVGALCVLIISASLILCGLSTVPSGKNLNEMGPPVDPTHYLHRTSPLTPTPAPAGLRMNTTAPPSGQTETTLQFNKGTNYYWYSDLLTPGCAAGGAWTFYVWADTATTLSTLDVRLDLTSSSGGNVRPIGSFIGTTINALTPTLYTISITGSGIGLQSNDRFRLTLFPEGGGSNDSHMNIIYDGYGSETVGSETRLSTIVSFTNCSLNLRVRNWSLTDTITGALVYKDSQVQVSSSNGWANWTSVGGIVQIKVQYYGYWVNGTFPVTLDSNKTLDIRANIYNITVTVRPANQEGVLQSVNVTVYNSTQYGPASRIATGLTDANGRLSLQDVPNGTLFFTSYAKSDYSILISGFSQTVSTNGQSISLIADQNAGTATLPWEVFFIASFVLSRWPTAPDNAAKRKPKT